MHMEKKYIGIRTERDRIQHCDIITNPHIHLMHKLYTHIQKIHILIQKHLILKIFYRHTQPHIYHILTQKRDAKTFFRFYTENTCAMLVLGIYYMYTNV